MKTPSPTLFIFFLVCLHIRFKRAKECCTEIDVTHIPYGFANTACAKILLYNKIVLTAFAAEGDFKSSSLFADSFAIEEDLPFVRIRGSHEGPLKRAHKSMIAC